VDRELEKTRFKWIETMTCNELQEKLNRIHTVNVNIVKRMPC
jgi:hypothetical protein